MTKFSPPTHRGYGAGHCWYYLLGGAVLTLKQIKQVTMQSGYKGYARDDIAQADSRAEPKRSEELRRFRKQFEVDLRRDITVYRKCALELHRDRKANPLTEMPNSAADVHVSISLKHNHIVNNFAHLITLDELLSQQGELFG